MAGRLQGKTVLISGTGNGQGRAAALRFAAESAAVVGADIDADAAAETAALVRANGGAMESMHPVDLSVDDDVAAWANRAVEVYGGVDVLYNNAASFRRGTVETLTPDDWQYTFANEVVCIASAIRHALPVLRAGGGGSIINIASVAGVVGLGFPGNARGNIAHCVGKAAVIRLTECVAIELASDRIRVNAISPGPVATQALARFFTESAPVEFRGWFAGCGLADRIGAPDDIVNTALFLASDESTFITGINIPVDGGYTASGGVGRPSEEIEEAMRAV